ncbi:hypothetical protein HUU53_02785 [Candidatus Micrarchaeota archaeon]|nr:hypothetical protein [Candidatus Micrarchaeota archaeon]
MVLVEKNGVKKKFDGEEVIQSIIKAGGSKDLGEDIVSRLGSKLNRTSVISTKELKKMVAQVLAEKNKTIADAYSSG